jgi:serpin B
MNYSASAQEKPATDEAASAINNLGLRIFESWPDAKKNICLSPYSITAALAMTYPGSSGETRMQMREALGFPENPDSLASSFHALDALLSSDSGDKDVALRRANRLFGQQGYHFRTDFLSLLGARFSAPLQEMNFKTAHEAARKEINNWVEEQTEDRIQDLLPGGSLDEEIRLVLVNALYFKAPWRNEFSPGGTAERPFQTIDGDEVSVPTMQQTERMGYKKIPGATVVALPYRGLPFQFLAILPDGVLKESSGLLTADFFEQCREIPFSKVQLHMPKFRIEPPTINLADVLAAMGMPSAFDRPLGSADFDAMTPRTSDEYLYVSGVYHKTFIEVDEKGTEAAAATAVAMMRATSMDLDEPVEVHLNRPFFYAIQHQPSGAVFFLGQIADPG